MRRCKSPKRRHLYNGADKSAAARMRIHIMRFGAAAAQFLTGAFAWAAAAAAAVAAAAAAAAATMDVSLYT